MWLTPICFSAWLAQSVATWCQHWSNTVASEFTQARVTSCGLASFLWCCLARSINQIWYQKYQVPVWPTTRVEILMKFWCAKIRTTLARMTYSFLYNLYGRSVRLALLLTMVRNLVCGNKIQIYSPLRASNTRNCGKTKSPFEIDFYRPIRPWQQLGKLVSARETT